jgi:hypothetical protein
LRERQRAAGTEADADLGQHHHRTGALIAHVNVVLACEHNWTSARDFGKTLLKLRDRWIESDAATPALVDWQHFSHDRKKRGKPIGTLEISPRAAPASTHWQSRFSIITLMSTGKRETYVGQL